MLTIKTNLSFTLTEILILSPQDEGSEDISYLKIFSRSGEDDAAFSLLDIIVLGDRRNRLLHYSRLLYMRMVSIFYIDEIMSLICPEELFATKFSRKLHKVGLISSRREVK